MLRVPFQKLSKEIQRNRLLSPWFVSVTKNPDEETREQVMNRHNAMHKLQEDDRMKMGSEEVMLEMEAIGKRFNLTVFQLSDIARAIRSYYFQEITLDDFSLVLQKELHIDTSLSEAISQEVVANIIQRTIQQEDASVKSTPLILLKALEKYPRINDQQITGDRIVVRSEKDSVRGTVRNWLRAYRDAVGIRKHSDIERGHFLFQSENAKKLPPSGRERVAALLKALDENETLDIDTENQRIVFTVQPLVASLPPKPLPATPALGSLPSWQHTKAPLQRFHMTTKQEASPLQQNQTAPPKTQESPFRFSSGQTLSSEKREENVMATPSAPLPPIAPPSQNTNSFGLGYVGPTTNTSPSSQKIQQEREKKVWGIPETLRNVVDLRSDDDEI